MLVEGQEEGENGTCRSTLFLASRRRAAGERTSRLLRTPTGSFAVRDVILGLDSDMFAI